MRKTLAAVLLAVVLLTSASLPVAAQFPNPDPPYQAYFYGYFVEAWNIARACPGYFQQKYAKPDYFRYGGHRFEIVERGTGRIAFRGYTDSMGWVEGSWTADPYRDYDISFNPKWNNGVRMYYPITAVAWDDPHTYGWSYYEMEVWNVNYNPPCGDTWPWGLPRVVMLPEGGPGGSFQRGN